MVAAPSAVLTWKIIKGWSIRAAIAIARLIASASARRGWLGTWYLGAVSPFSMSFLPIQLIMPWFSACTQTMQPCSRAAQSTSRNCSSSTRSRS
jgi:hypothetical protein